jgi:hypothetical protein
LPLNHFTLPVLTVTPLALADHKAKLCPSIFLI